jgi:subtilisin family serine protease
MKKILFTILSLFFLAGTVHAADCNSMQEPQYTTCYNNFVQFYNQAVNHFNGGNFELAIENAMSALNFQSDNPDAKNIVVTSYFRLGDQGFTTKNYEKAITNYLKVLEYLPGNYAALFNIGASYYNLGKFQQSLPYFDSALAATTDTREIANTKQLIKEAELQIANQNSVHNTAELKKNSIVNDELSYLQYYIKNLNINGAWAQLPATKKPVLIAVIDDGVNVNHPDLTSNLWVNNAEIPGNNKDDDRNGYIDDYNGWNFIYDGNNVLPLGEHGTMVAGIIWAVTNNTIGVAGIVPNVKIMSIGVLDSNGGNSDDIVKAIRYAITMKADIINLSLGGNQFVFSDVFTKVLKEAYDKGIVVVTAAGNWDSLSAQANGVNTDINKLSPLCNDQANKKMLIGVGAIDKDGKRTSRSNYGNCVDIYTYGIGITSTSVAIYNTANQSDYNTLHGTSFSSPIIAGIIGLGFNKFGKVSPDMVYDALMSGQTKSPAGTLILDANLYLKNLEILINKKKSVNIIGGNELESAVRWMYSNGLTSFSSLSGFNEDGELTREQAAKFYVQFAKNILSKKSDGALPVQFTDLETADKTLQQYIIQSSQMGLFKWSEGEFLPFNNLTSAQSIAVLMRAKYWSSDESSTPWYREYFTKANDLGLLTGLGFTLTNMGEKNITRKEIALMMYRMANQ